MVSVDIVFPLNITIFIKNITKIAPQKNNFSEGFKELIPNGEIEFSNNF